MGSLKFFMLRVVSLDGQPSKCNSYAAADLNPGVIRHLKRKTDLADPILSPGSTGSPGSAK